MAQGRKVDTDRQPVAQLIYRQLSPQSISAQLPDSFRLGSLIRLPSAQLPNLYPLSSAHILRLKYRFPQAKAKKPQAN